MFSIFEFQCNYYFIYLLYDFLMSYVLNMYIKNSWFNIIMFINVFVKRVMY